MKSLLEKLAAAAAQASAPKGGGAGAPPAGGAGAQDPNMDPAMMMPDPIEQDNMRLTNILQNLKLRQEVVQAQAELVALTAQIEQAKKKAPQDPDKPRPTGGPVEDVTHASALTEILKRTPKISTNKKELPSGKKQKNPPKGKPETTTPGKTQNTDPGAQEPTQYSGPQQ